MSVNAFLDDSGSVEDSKDEPSAQRPTSQAECPQAGSSAAGKEVAAGGCLCNTHPQSSQIKLKDYPDYQFAGGYDWLEWGALVQWDEERFQSLTKKLEQAKAYCQEKKLPCHWLGFENIGGLLVSRTGGNRGGDHGEHYEYKVLWGGITMGIAYRSMPRKTVPNVYVRLTGRECLLLGAMDGYHIARELITGLGGKIMEEKLSRVDLSIDISGLDVRELQELVERQQFVTEAGSVEPKWDVLRERKTGFTAGKSPMRLVVYDKVLEVDGKFDRLYAQGLIDRRWGGSLPAKATRVEYQCSRSWLLNQGVSSPEDLFRLQGSLVQKLTSEWFRVTDRCVDRRNKNQSRAETLPLWSAIGTVFGCIYGQQAGPLLPVHREKIEPLRLMKQARGCLRNALLQMRRECRNYQEFVKQAAKLLDNVGLVTKDATRFMDEYHRMELEFLT